ncbi:MAG: Smr/MutS family protein, partial [Clostridia bacterium]|nr:Smr/MutS family protein [Clostridia bacterium]
LADEVIEHARGLVDDETLHFEDVIDRLEEARIKTEEERRKAEALRREIEELSIKAREREKHFDEERAKFTANARAEGERILRDTRAEAAALIAEIRDILNKKDASPIDLNEVHANVNRRLNEMENKSRKEANVGTDEKVPELERMPEVGEKVHLRKMNVDGVVLKKPKDGFVSVQAGILKMNVALSDISLLPKEKPKQAVNPGISVKTVGVKDAVAAYRCDLRGMTADEALAELDIFINRAVMQHMPAATIVHGKGTGKLREAAQDYLRHSRFVKSFRLGVYGEGDSGVTVVEFKNN